TSTTLATRSARSDANFITRQPANQRLACGTSNGGGVINESSRVPGNRDGTRSRSLGSPRSATILLRDGGAGQTDTPERWLRHRRQAKTPGSGSHRSRFRGGRSSGKARASTSFHESAGTLVRRTRSSKAKPPERSETAAPQSRGSSGRGAPRRRERLSGT